MPLPKSHAMYLTRNSPMMRDRKVDTIRITVAEYTLCACDGCSSRNPRAHRDRTRGDG